jgi:hypothetical protein
MIGMNSLGKNGRIGNQLFQYAALIGIAKNRGFDFCIPDHSQIKVFEDSSGRSEYHQLQKCFKLSYLNGRYGYIDGDIVELNQHHFCKELFDECPDNVTLHGHFESYKYFENVRQELKKDLEFHENIKEESEKFHKKNNLKNPVAIIIRRGDFLLYPNCHPVCDSQYYEKCMNHFENDRQYVIISDDIEWCKNQNIFSGNNFYFVDKTPNKLMKAHYDMCIGSICDHFIISNSTFAWWISWLGSNQNKQVYMPDPWFGATYNEWITDGYYSTYSIKIGRKI